MGKKKEVPSRSVASLAGKVKGYFGGVVVEMKKVSWPGKEELKESTIVVITVTGILAMFTFGIDVLIGEVIKQFF